MNFNRKSSFDKKRRGRQRRGECLPIICLLESYSDKAQKDLNSVMSQVSHEDSLYAQAGYERALLSYQSGDKARALQQFQQLVETAKPKAMSQQIKEKLRSLQTNIALGTVENKSASPEGTTKDSLQETVRNLKRIAYADESQAGVLYQYVFEHASALANFPDSELGSMGTMAIADWYFDRKKYEPTIERYQRLYSAPDALIRRHMDNVCFRLAYALAQKEKWQNALSCLETLFAKYPKSSFGGKAACLYYIAAVRAYKAKPGEEAFNPDRPKTPQPNENGPDNTYSLSTQNRLKQR